MNQTQTLEDVIGQPVGSMVATGTKDPVTGRMEKSWKGLPDCYLPGPGDNYRLGSTVRPQGPDGPAFVKERVSDPVTGHIIEAWRHIQGAPAPGCGGLL